MLCWHAHLVHQAPAFIPRGTIATNLGTQNPKPWACGVGRLKIFSFFLSFFFFFVGQDIRSVA